MMNMMCPFLSGGLRGGFILNSGASLERGLSWDAKKYTTINWNAGKKHNNIRLLDFDGFAAASLEENLLSSKVTQAVLSCVAAASSEAKLIGLKIT